jgi:hypothetical protein
VIVLDTHIGCWWTGGEHQRLSQSLLDQLANAPKMGVRPFASVDGHFAAYPELAGQRLA